MREDLYLRSGCAYFVKKIVTTLNDIWIMEHLLMLNVGYAVHDSDWNFKKVNSPFSRIYYVTRGCARVVINGIIHDLVPGHLYLIPAFTQHDDICDGRFEHYYVHIYENDALGLNLTERLELPVSIKGTKMDEMLFRNLCDHNRAMVLKDSDPQLYDNKHALINCVRLNRKRPLFDRLESAGIIYQLLSRFVKYSKPKFQTSDPRIQNALDIINAGLSETMHVDELSKNVGMSTDHFIRLFKGELGCTPARFIIEKKMMRARLKIATEMLLIKEIAYSLGYDDVSYFSRLFKKYVGVSPYQYRMSFNT